MDCTVTAIDDHHSTVATANLRSHLHSSRWLPVGSDSCARAVTGQQLVEQKTLAAASGGFHLGRRRGSLR